MHRLSVLFLDKLLCYVELNLLIYIMVHQLIKMVSSTSSKFTFFFHFYTVIEKHRRKSFTFLIV